MKLQEYDDDDLLDELKHRSIDARTIKEFSTQELHNELQRREEEQERRIQAMHDAEMAEEEDQ